MQVELSDEERHRLIEKHLDYVRSLAGEIARKLPPTVVVDDLVAYGHQGLVEAAQRFDPSRGASFGTFAYYRIRGAIYDGIRRMSWFGRSKLPQHADVQFEACANDLLGPAWERDAAAQTEAAPATAEQSLRDLADLFGDLSIAFVGTLEGFEQTRSEQPPTDLPKRELSQAMQALPERERELIRMVYLEDESLKEAGDKLGLSRSWASRLHARAIRLLRQHLEDTSPEFHERSE